MQLINSKLVIQIIIYIGKKVNNSAHKTLFAYCETLFLKFILTLLLALYFITVLLWTYYFNPHML